MREPQHKSRKSTDVCFNANTIHTTKKVLFLQCQWSNPSPLKPCFFMTKANKFWPHFSFVYLNHKIHLFRYKVCQIFITPSICELVILLFSLMFHFLWKGNIYWNMFPLPGLPKIHASSSRLGPQCCSLNASLRPQWHGDRAHWSFVWQCLQNGLLYLTAQLRMKNKFWCYSVKSLI